MLILVPVIVFGTDEADTVNWPGFRGDGSSLVNSDALPLTWNNEDGVAWRVDLAGFGQSSPVIWNGTVYVTSTGGEHKEHLYVEAFDLDSGKRQWIRELEASVTVEKVSKMISQGAPTPVAGPEGVTVFFESGDLVSLDTEGKVRWSRSLTEEYGPFKGGHGVGSSLVGVPGQLVLLIDHDGPSYLLCLDRKTGETAWRTEREARVSWTTPLYLDHPDGGRLLVSSNGSLEGFRLKDGERLWWIDGITKNTVASPSSDGRLVVMPSSNPKQSMAVRLGGKGELGEDHEVWRAESVVSSFPSPLLYHDMAFFINRAGTLLAQDMEDGRSLWKHRLPGETWASPIGAGDRVYVFCKNGKAAVLKPDKAKPVVLAENAIEIPEEEIVYGVAATQSAFVLRTGRELIRIGGSIGGETTD